VLVFSGVGTGGIHYRVSRLYQRTPEEEQFCRLRWSCSAPGDYPKGITRDGPRKVQAFTHKIQGIAPGFVRVTPG